MPIFQAAENIPVEPVCATEVEAFSDVLTKTLTLFSDQKE